MSHQANINIEEAMRDTLEESARRRSGINYERLGEQMRRIANNMESISDWVAVLGDAKKKNPRGLIF